MEPLATAAAQDFSTKISLVMNKSIGQHKSSQHKFQILPGQLSQQFIISSILLRSPSLTMDIAQRFLAKAKAVPQPNGAVQKYDA